METATLWSGVLTFGVTAIGWFAKTLWDEQHRLQVLLNKTREEVAKDYVTKTDVQASINMLIARIDNLDHKIDALLRSLAK
jgi:Tfp pilus assembly protein PilO